ncbi:MAG: acetolactate synthase small subunit [Methylacidiphilales bacterium]|nr:acetolactate synthase small subunit [Candidatus Methylacidiphilales bacterium]
MEDKQRFTISVLLENQPGALARVANLFSARGYNIEALNVAPTTDPTLSHMTITTIGKSSILKQICSQLEKLIDVFSQCSVSTENAELREIALVLIANNELVKDAIIKNCINANVVYSLKTRGAKIMIEIYGNSDTIDSIIKTMDKTNLILVARSGALALPYAGYNNYQEEKQ